MPTRFPVLLALLPALGLAACSETKVLPDHPVLRAAQLGDCSRHTLSRACEPGDDVDIEALDRIESYLRNRELDVSDSEFAAARQRWSQQLEDSCRPLEALMMELGLEPSWQLSQFLLNLQLKGEKPDVARRETRDGGEGMQVSYGAGPRTSILLLRAQDCPFTTKDGSS